MYVGDYLDVRKHVRLQPAVAIRHFGTNFDAARIGIYNAGNQNDSTCESRSRKSGHDNFHFLTNLHSLEIFFEYVCIDPNTREVNDLEQIRVGADGRANRRIAFDDDARDRRVQRELRRRETWPGCQGLDFFVLQSMYEQISPGRA